MFKYLNRLIILIAIIVVLITIIGVGVLIWQKDWIKGNSEIGQEVNIADWKTYTNIEYEFSFQYPQNSKLLDFDINGGREVYINLPIDKTTNLTEKVLSIKIITRQWNNGVPEPASCNSIAFFNYPTSNVVINGITFKKADVSGAFGGTMTSSIATEYCTMNNGKTYIITYILTSNKNKKISLLRFNPKKESETLDKIISTFKFTTWKTYTNSDWGIKFKYPLNLGNIKTDGNLLSFVDPQNENQFNLFFLKRTTLEDIAKCNQDCERCLKDGSCQMCPPCMSSSDYWHEQKKFIETSNVGKVDCLGHTCQNCEIEKVGNIKMLVRHNCFGPGAPINNVYKVFYNNNALYEFLPNGESRLSEYGIDEKTILSTFEFIK